MVQTKSQAIAAERQKTTKAQQDKLEAEQEKAEAMAKNAHLKEQLREQLAQLKEKSGPFSNKSVATAPLKKGKEAPSAGSFAQKLQCSVSKMEAMLGAKCQYGGHRQNTKDGVSEEMLTRVHTAIKNDCFTTTSTHLGQRARKNSSKPHSTTSR